MADELKEIKIHRIEFDITRNGDICTRVWKDNDTAIFFHSDSHFLITRQEGDKITYRTNTKGFNSIVIPEVFADSYSSNEPMGKMMRRLHENFRVALNQSKNGTKTGLTEYETENYIDENFDEMELFVNKVFTKFKSTEDEFCKHVNKEFDIKRASRTLDPEAVVQKFGFKLYDNFKKNYKIDKAD